MEWLWIFIISCFFCPALIIVAILAIAVVVLAVGGVIYLVFMIIGGLIDTLTE